MLHEWLLLFIIITLITLIISAYLMETQPYLSIPFIILGLIFSVLCSYGVWDVEFAMLQSDDTFVINSANYGEPYSYVFIFIFFIFFLFFIRAGWNTWKEALETKGEFNYNDKQDYFR